MPWRLLALFLVAVLQPACLQIPDYDETGCGDSILGAGEDCDGRYVSLDGTCGAPGTEHACHYVCSSGAASECPDGWRCGVDGRCSQPQPRLVSPQMEEPLPVLVTDVIDMDSDGFDDLLSTSSLSISTHFSDGSGRFDTVFNLSLPQGSGTPIWVAPLEDDVDAPNDALIPLGPTLLALSGQETRGFISRLFPTEIVSQTVQEAAGVALEADRERFNADSELLVLSDLVEPDGTTRSAMAFNRSRCDGPGELLPDDQRVSNLGYKTVQEAGTRIPRADLDDDGFTELALAFRGSTKLYLYGSTGTPGSTEPTTCLRPVPYTRTPEIATPDGYMLSDHNPLFVDIDGDTDLDVLMSLASVDESLSVLPILTEAVAVAEALGDGTYETQAAIVPGLVGWSRDGGAVLAAGDLDGDGVAEYVTPEGILRIDQPPALPAQVVFLTRPSGASWVTAEVLDLNDDGALDVVAAASGGLDWFLNATPTGLTGQLNRFTLAAPPGDPQLRTGDFNGDLRPDVAAIARVDATHNELVVVFGSAAGVPGDVQPMGGFGGRVHFVEAGLTAEPSAGDVDGLTDLFLWTSTDPAEGDRPSDVAFFALQGSTSQRLFSPFHVLGDPDDTAGADVVVAAVGNFIDGPTGVSGAPITPRSVAVVSEPAPTAGPEEPHGELTLLVSTRPGELRPARPDPLPVLPLATFDVRSARWLVGNVVPDENVVIDELVGIENPSLDESNPALTIVVMSVRMSGLGVEVESIDLPAEYGSVSAARLADVDADGRPDLVLILARSGSPGEVEARILWNQGCPTRRFCIDDEGSTLLRAVNEQNQPLAGEPRDIVAMQLEDDERRELVVLYTGLPGAPPDERKLFILADQDGDRSYTASEVTFPKGPNRVARTLAVGDVNGDGLDDLVLNADPLASVLLQEPAAPLGSTEDDQTSNQAESDQTEEETP
jgi:hypothetical protein